MSHKKQRISEDRKASAQIEEDIQVDFEGRSPDTNDLDGISQLLKQLFVRAPVDVSALARSIIAQNYVGSVLKQCVDDEDTDDEDDMDTVFGITTVINLSNSDNLSNIEQIKMFLLDKAREDSTEAYDNLHPYFNTNHWTSLLVNERFVNISPVIAVPLFESLIEEMQKAKDERNFKCDSIVVIVKLFKNLDEKNDVKEVIYTNPEEEIFFEHKKMSFDYCLKTETDTAISGNWTESDEPLTAFRRVIVVDFTNMVKIISEIKKVL